VISELDKPMSNRRTLQILDASGWIAVYDVGSGDVRQLLTRPLVCWALVEDADGPPGQTRVVGIDAEQAAENAGRPPEPPPAGRQLTFLGYARDGDSLTRFHTPPRPPRA